METNYYIYILTTQNNTVLYTGITSDLMKRVYEHRNKMVQGFTNKYNLNKLIYYESCQNVTAAIEREKEIKGWTRKKKIGLIESFNKDWNDLYERL